MRLVRPVAFAVFLFASQAALAVAHRPSADRLGFETIADDPSADGWDAVPADTVRIDRSIVHGGRQALRIARGRDSGGELSTVGLAIPIDFDGRVVELRGYLKTDGLDGFAQLGIVEHDADGKVVLYRNAPTVPLSGTSDWAAYSVRAPVLPHASKLLIGVGVGGTGTLWVDDLRLFVDGVAIEDVPLRKPSGIERDHAFDAGSALSITALSAAQVDALTLLGQVWGFVKYHHPRVTSGDLQWDYELLRIAPRVLAAPDRASVDARLVEWIDGLGPVPPCARCAELDPVDLALAPSIAWIDDGRRIGASLRARLRAIHRSRPADDRQFHLSMAEWVGNPSFDHELPYPDIALSDSGFRLLALYRFWNIVEYWFPYRDRLDEDWTAVLQDALPRIVLAPDRDAYRRELTALIARVHDSHANLWSSLGTRPPTGPCAVPVELRFVEGRRLVVAATPAGETGLARGDEVVAIDGTGIDESIDARRRYYAASNEAARLRDMARFMTRGACGPVRLSVRDTKGRREVDTMRTTVDDGLVTHDLPGPTFQRLSNEVAYLKLSSVKVSDVPRYLEAAAGSRGLVIDLRNYPSGFVVFALGNRLVDRPTPFVRFTRGDVANPGAFHWSEPLSLTPGPMPPYRGKVVILVDEVSQSQAEYTAMAFRTAPNAVVVGSTTAGADGNVSTILLPGGLSTMISGIGVFHPDRRPTQRVGIVADVEARPTIEGIRAGRDEVLEAGLRQIVDQPAAAAIIERLPRR